MSYFRDEYWKEQFNPDNEEIIICGDCKKEISAQEFYRNDGVCDKCQYLYYEEEE